MPLFFCCLLPRLSSSSHSVPSPLPIEASPGRYRLEGCLFSTWPDRGEQVYRQTDRQTDGRTDRRTNKGHKGRCRGRRAGGRGRHPPAIGAARKDRQENRKAGGSGGAHNKRAQRLQLIGRIPNWCAERVRLSAGINAREDASAAHASLQATLAARCQFPAERRKRWHQFSF